MTSEREWVRSFITRLDVELQRSKLSNSRVSVKAADGVKLSYACEIDAYLPTDEPQISMKKYETDILIFDSSSDGGWIPRVVVECKLEGITTHDALTYSSKASTHRSVHPYLRYGFLAGQRSDYALPARLIRHGQEFDFMLSWKALKASPKEWKSFLSILKDEIDTSRKLQTLLSDNRSRTRVKNSGIHKSMAFVRVEEKP